MTAYRYRALNPAGKLVRGVMEGDSERQVRAQLRTQSLRPVDVGEANRALHGQSSWRLSLPGTGVSAGDLALITRQLATLVESNLPLDEALQAAAQQSRSARIKGTLLQVRSRVAEGHTLAFAMGEFPQVFREMYRAMVNAGEHSGYLGPVLQQLADYTEQRQYTGQKLKMAMIYPFILVAVAVAVVVALMVFVVPELVGILRLFPRLWPMAVDGAGAGLCYGTAGFAKPCPAPKLAPFPVACAGAVALVDCTGYGALRVDPEHTDGQWRAATGFFAYRR
jgi:general secretion pathway protein F